MRTKKEIRQYLKRSPWWPLFVKNLKKDLDTNSFKLRILLGYGNEETINEAFVWGETDEGYTYWEKIDYDFITWYYGNKSSSK